MTLDDARRANPALGFAVYAYTAGGPVTLEIHTPEGDVFAFQGDTEVSALEVAFPESDLTTDIDTQPQPAETDIFG